VPRRIERVYVCLIIIIIIIIVTALYAVILRTLQHIHQYFIFRDTLKMEAGYSYETLLRICQTTLHHPQKTVISIFTAVETSQHGKSSPTFRRDILAPSSILKSKLSKQELCFLLASCWLLAFLFRLVDGGSMFLRNVSHHKTVNFIVTAVEISNLHTALLHQYKYLVVDFTALSVLQTTGRLVNNEL
jgi:hypothetical protein